MNFTVWKFKIIYNVVPNGSIEEKHQLAFQILTMVYACVKREEGPFSGSINEIELVAALIFENVLLFIMSLFFVCW